jgi:hypothetical protein
MKFIQKLVVIDAVQITKSMFAESDRITLTLDGQKVRLELEEGKPYVSKIPWAGLTACSFGDWVFVDDSDIPHVASDKWFRRHYSPFNDAPIGLLPGDSVRVTNSGCKWNRHNSWDTYDEE